MSTRFANRKNPNIIKKQEEERKASKDSIKMLKDELLLDDPANAEIYGEHNEEELQSLEESIRMIGFDGVIYAYPVEDGKYRILSGHRRREAGRRAGMKEFPVVEVDAPKSTAEKTIRLNMANLHNREMKPSIMAKLCEKQSEAHKEMMQQESKETGFKYKKTDAVEAACADLQISQAMFYRYLNLLKISQRLRDIADEGIYSWSELSGASKLSEEKQEELADWLDEKKAQNKAEQITRPVLQNAIELLLNPKEDEGEDLSAATGQEDKPLRKASALKVYAKLQGNVTEILGKEVKYRKKDKAEVIALLKEIRKSVDRRIREIENDK